MKRKRANKGRDAAIFRNTATKSKKINVGVTNYRGGIRF